MEKSGKIAAEQKIAWEESQKALRSNANQMKQDVENSFVAQYWKGLKEEASVLKKQLKDEMTQNNNNNQTKH